MTKWDLFHECKFGLTFNTIYHINKLKKKILKHIWYLTDIEKAFDKNNIHSW